MNKKFIRIIALILIFSFVFQQSGFAQIATELNIAGHLSALRNSFVVDKFRPLHLRYLQYLPQDNSFKLYLDKGDQLQKGLPPTSRGHFPLGLSGNSLQESVPWDDAKLQAETKAILNYFFIGLTLPNDSFWVNLRPDAEDNIIDEYLSKTDIGKIMLETDLQLKKDTASFTSPQTPEGREYWDRLYKKAAELYGYDNVTIPTLTRPWIVPGEIIVRESKDSAYVYKATLKVMLESDYLRDGSRQGAGILPIENRPYVFKDERSKALNEYSTQLIRELIIPKLTKEVNSSKRYAPLRQVYYSLILAQWFKARYKDRRQKTEDRGQKNTVIASEPQASEAISSRIDSRNLTNLISKEAWSKTTYFQAYQKSFKDGEYNIQESVYTPTGQVIRSYFSGGENFGNIASPQMIIIPASQSASPAIKNLIETPSVSSPIDSNSASPGYLEDLAMSADSMLKSLDQIVHDLNNPYFKSINLQASRISDKGVYGLSEKVREQAKEIRNITGDIFYALRKILRGSEDDSQKLNSLKEIVANLPSSLNTLMELAANLEENTRNINLEQKTTKETNYLQDDIKSISAGVGRIDGILFNYVVSDHKSMVNLNSLLKTSFSIIGSQYRHLMGGEFTYKFDYAPDLPPIFANPSRLNRVFDNLFNNVFAAMKGKEDGMIVVITRLDETGKNILVEIKDNGIGIPKESINRVFEPYFTTKAEGTGLGLVIVKRFIEELGGKITVESELGEGAKFTIKLPIAQDADEPKVSSPLEDNPAAGSKMVKNSEASLDSVTEEEVEAVLEDMNRHFEYNSSYDKQKIRTMALKILKLGIIKGKSFLVVGPSKMDLLPIFLAKLGLKTTIIDIDESSVKYQKMIYEEIGIKGKVVAFTSYTELGDRKFDYVSILGVAHEATFSAELVFGDSGAYESRMKEFLIPIVEHLNLEGGYIFVNTPQYTNSLRYERAVLDSFKRILSTYGNELNTNFILQYDADINNFSLHLGHLQEKRIGKVYKAVNKVSGSINSAGSEKPSSSQEDNPAAGSPRAGQSASSSAMEVKTETSLGHRLGTSSPINDRSIADAYELFEKHFAIPRDGSIGSPFEDEPRLIAKLFANGRVSIFDQQDEHPGREMPWLDIWLRQGPDMDKMYLVIAAENKIPEDHLLSQFMPRIIKHAKEAIDFINHKVEEPIDIQFANHLVRGWSTDEFYEFFAKVFNDVGHSVWQNNFKDITGSDVKNWLSDISWAYLNSDVQVKQIGIRLVSKLGVTASPKERYQFLQQWMEALSRENISPIAGRLSYLSLQGNMLQGPTGSPLMQSETQKTPNTASPINRGLGGIDFRSLPIVIQAMSNLRNSLGDSLQFRTVGDTFRQGSNESLKRKMSPSSDKELQEIEKLVEAGITPSTQRIKEYVASSCVKGSILQDKDKVILCIADILRSEEETCLATDPTLRDILVVLEASGSSAELSRIFLG